MLQCVAVCCSVLQCIAVCCSVLQCVAVCCSVFQCVAVCCSVLQCVPVCCSVSQCVAVWRTVLQCDADKFVSNSMPPRAAIAECYAVATVSRIDKIIGLFCRISSLLQGSFAKETHNFIDPTNRSHPICCPQQPKCSKILF